MNRADERAEFLSRQVLDFVDGKDDAGISSLRGTASFDQQIGEIIRQVARIRNARQRIDVQGDRRAIRQVVGE